MRDGKDIVPDQLVIGVFDGDQTVCRVRPFRIGLVLIHELRGQDTCQVLLQQRVDTYLEIAVDGQVHVIASNRSCLALHLHDMSHVVHVDAAGTLFPVEILLHVFFNACAADDIVQGVIAAQLLEACQLVLLDPAYISDDMGEGNAVIVYALRGLFAAHAEKLRLVFQDLGAGKFLHVVDDSGAFITLEGGEAHGVADVDELHRFEGRELSRASVLVLQTVQAIVFDAPADQFLRRDVRRVITCGTGQILHSPQSVEVTQEALPCVFADTGVTVFSVLVDTDLQTPHDGLPVGVQDLHQAVQHGVAFTDSLIVAGVLHCHVVGKTVVGQKFPVAVKDISAGGRGCHGLFCLLDVIVQIGLAVQDLEPVQPEHYDCQQKSVACSQQKKPGGSQPAAQLFRQFFQVVQKVFQQSVGPQFTACFSSRISSFRLYHRKKR